MKAITSSIIFNASFSSWILYIICVHRRWFSFIRMKGAYYLWNMFQKNGRLWIYLNCKQSKCKKYLIWISKNPLEQGLFALKWMVDMHHKILLKLRDNQKHISAIHIRIVVKLKRHRMNRIHKQKLSTNLCLQFWLSFRNL